MDIEKRMRAGQIKYHARFAVLLCDLKHMSEYDIKKNRQRIQDQDHPHGDADSIPDPVMSRINAYKSSEEHDRPVDG